MADGNRRLRGWLWVVATLLTVVAAGWQRRTGPSYPYRAALTLGDTTVAARLPRSHVTTAEARVTVPAPDPAANGMLHWRRYPTDDPLTATPMTREGDHLAAALPVQPRAGKVEYFLELTAGAGSVRVPASADETIILRYRGPVPAGILIPHIAFMFVGMLVGVRAALGALGRSGDHAQLTWITLGGLTLGGLLLGPITQEYAFGTYWTGVPFGWDLTDNKTLFMWIGWAVAALALARAWRAARGIVALAAVLMLVVYLIPHSAQGSQFDYADLPTETTAPPSPSAPAAPLGNQV